MRSLDINNVWSAYRDANVELLVSVMRFTSIETAKELKLLALGTYPAHFVVLGESTIRKERLMRSVHTLVSVLPVCFAPFLLKEERNGEDQEMRCTDVHH